MKSIKNFILLVAAFILGSQNVMPQVISYTDSWGENGFILLTETRSGISVNHSLKEFLLEEVDVDGTPAMAIRIPGVFLPNDEGAPDLPGTGRYIAIPNGSEIRMKITASRTEVMQGVEIAPAPRIPLDTEPDPLLEKDLRIYSKNAFYPENPVTLSEPMQIRGIDAVVLAVTPFQYNPVTKELIIYRDLQVEVTYQGGNGKVGEDRLRSRWWDPVIKRAVLNANAIPEMNWEVSQAASRTPDYEYLIITPNVPVFLQWADSIKIWRTLQGIKTGVVTTTEIGGNTTTAIKNYINNAYNNWDVPPAAVLLLGDYSTGSDGITSYFYPHLSSTYPDYPSDNYFADVNNDNLPDIVFARITARNATELSVMITKFLNYERNPPVNPNFYNRPITALGWQTERWFQICSEVIGGYFRNVHGMTPVRINALYAGNPSVDPWSTAYNTSTVVNYFGPNGLGYIPATPQELGGFTGGTGTQVVNAINSGSFLLQHRDHGSYSGWGEPAFYTSTISQLNNVNNQLPFVFSINCQTGAFNRSTECFAERFHRYTYNGQNSGALGIIAATEVSYSFVNDTYIWGVYDNMFPDFMPGYATTFPNSYAMPAFGNAAGKYFLQQSSWASSGAKVITYRLFHHHGDAFMPIYYAVPQQLTVVHDAVHINGEPNFTVTANAGSLIALTVGGEIVAVATGTGSPLEISIPPVNPDHPMIVTVTKQNYFRYSEEVVVVSEGIHAAFSAIPRIITFGEGVTFTDLSFGEITSWNWSFPGGTPEAFAGKYPPVIYYNTPGIYDVTLTVSDGTESNTQTKTGYITVKNIEYCAANGNATAEWIASVNIGGQVKTSGSSGSAGYQDHTGFVFALDPGNSYSLAITPGFQGPGRFEYYKVWIDFNYDGDFLDPGEEVFSASKSKSAVYGNINIPAGISVETRMRVTMKRDALPSSCETFSAGEVEDFTVRILAPTPQPPVADFSANPLQVTVGQSVQFTDLSTNNPTAWAWSFPNGTPETSTSQNPNITYNSLGTFDVTLTVTNAEGQDTETKIAYIEVVESPPPPPPSSYCEPVAINNGPDYINQVTIGSVSNTSGKGSSGYLYYTSPVFSFVPGQTYAVTLVPYNSANRNFWRIWIDFNGDGDFEDSGETLLTINNKKGTTTSSISIPSSASGTTRMRISMKTGGSQNPCDDNFNGEVEDYDVIFNSEEAMMASLTGKLVLRVYPNPAHDELTMIATGNINPVNVRIFNTQGNLVHSIELCESLHKIDISALPPGLYMIIAQDGNHVVTEKVIVR